MYSSIKYLATKKTVDDRSLNRHVWNTLVQEVMLLSTRLKKPIQVLEIGSGIGTMLERMLEWKLFKEAMYTAVDMQNTNINETRHRLSTWASVNDFNFIDENKFRFTLERQDNQVFIRLEVEDVFEFIRREQGCQKWDLLVAHAFLDLIDLEAALIPLFSLLKPGGLFYFTLNFDGVTVFQPEIDEKNDNKIISLYHETMDQRRIHGKPSGDSQTGRHLYGLLKRAGVEVIDVGSSDWVVTPRNDGYTSDEEYFLHFIVKTVYDALKENDQLDKKYFEGWIKRRHEQIEKRELCYIAHQLDFLGKIPG